MPSVNVTLQFTPPSLRSDNSPLAPSDIASYQLQRGPAIDGVFSAYNTFAVGVPIVFPVTNTDESFWRLIAVDTGNRPSTPSVPIWVPYQAPVGIAPPKPPTNLVPVYS